MSKIIFTRSEDGGVSVVFPTSDTATDELALETVPDGVEYQIVNEDFVFPSDRLLRDAWTWAGIGKPIVEDLEKSKVIGVERVKNKTRELYKVAVDAEIFGDPTPRTPVEVQADCADAIEQINAAETPNEVKVLMTAFCDEPAPQ